LPDLSALAALKALAAGVKENQVREKKRKEKKGRERKRKQEILHHPLRTHACRQSPIALTRAPLIVIRGVFSYNITIYIHLLQETRKKANNTERRRRRRRRRRRGSAAVRSRQLL